MYCFTCVNSFNCVLNELSFWADISGEHAVFVKNLAHSSSIILSKEAISALANIEDTFSTLNEQVKKIRMIETKITHQNKIEIMELIDKFMFYDKYAVRIYHEIMQLGKEDKMFRLFLIHTIKEQKFMYQIFDNIKAQIFNIPSAP